MNSTIEKIAEEANLLGDFTPTKIPGRYAGTISIADIEKFAELIVKECAKISYAGLGADQLDEYDRGWQNGRNLASDLIKEHFGVEE